MKYRAMNLWRQKFANRSRDKQFKDLALLYYGGKYSWGHEIPEKVDCSGLICGVLILMGYPIRVNADDLMTKFFNKEADLGDLNLVFFVAKEDYGTGSRSRLAGQARHVGILMGDGVIFHAVSPTVCFEKLEDVVERYDNSDMIIKSVNWRAIENDRGHYGFDPELQ